MRVALIVYGSLDQPTGGYVYDRKVAEGLRAAGDDVEIVSIPHARFAPAHGVALATRVVRADVVIGDELCFRELGPAFALLHRKSARVLLVHHLSNWEEPPGWKQRALAVQERFAMEVSDAIVATSNATAERLMREHGVRAEVAVPGADRLPKRARRPQEKALSLLFVGSWIARKRLLDLVEAFARIGLPNAQLRIAGDATREPAYAAEVRAKMNAATADLGILDEDGLADAFATADALVLPSSLEGYGMVLTEALYAGVPVIASRAIAPAAGLDGDREALLFDEGGLEAALRRFTHDASLRERMQREAALRSATLPTWKGTRDAVRGVLLRASKTIA